MAIGASNISRSNWTLPFKVWKKWQKHPYPDHLHATIKRKDQFISGISFSQIGSVYKRWFESGLPDISQKPVTLDAKFGKSTFSAEIDPKWLRTPRSEVIKIEEANPFKGPVRMAWVNWFLLTYSEIDAGGLVPEKIEVEGESISNIPAISTGTVIWERAQEGSIFRGQRPIMTFDWADVFLLHALLEVAKDNGTLDQYKNAAGQLRAAIETETVTLDGVFDASRVLGIEGTMGYEHIGLFTDRVSKYAPSLIKWSDEGKISLNETLRRFPNTGRKERAEIFAKLKAACEPA